jgi:hypothetical protein
MAQSLLRLGGRLLQNIPAKQGLSNEYTINGQTKTAFEWIYGRPLGAAATATRQERAIAQLEERLAQDSTPFLGSNPFAMPLQAEATPEQIHLDDPKQFSMLWTNFDGIYQEVQPWEDVYAASLTDAEEATAQFWTAINQGGAAFNLLLPRKIVRFASGTLYLVDMSIFRMVQPHIIDGIVRFTPATKTWMWQDAATKTMRPIYIQVSGYRGEGQQYYSQNDPAWLYALQAAKASITVFGITWKSGRRRNDTWGRWWTPPTGPTSRCSRIRRCVRGSMPPAIHGAGTSGDFPGSTTGRP